ncbi:glycosyl hydrolase [Lacrimispora sp. JR3]|uniref:glycosyl hydrolase n=1 Tax=Lacrimispora sinapis TaxID=3111456 RepID=UPI0037497BE2
MKRLNEVLNGNTDNYILPFLWLHGEEESVLRETVEKIHDSGIRAFCVEARPHPDFLGKTWWRDMDILLEEAKQRNMKVWILDDSHFPTGYADGRVEREFPHLQKQFLACKVLDFIGPMKNAQAIIRYAFRDKKDKLISVTLGKKTGYQKIDPDTLIDITGQVVNHTLVSFDLPKGEWSVMIVTATFEGGEPETKGYLNPIDPLATDVLIDTVYEAHYEKYKEEFGKTIAGFFSDEPRFGNMHGATGSIGRAEMDIPWREDLLELLEKQTGTDCRKRLPLLFLEGGESGHQIRYEYMDLVSKLYSKHFNKRISDWCARHQVEYIGHTIEDNNAHARLGYGAGHFFRAMAHQDMAGIDVVFHQLMPGMDGGIFKSKTKAGWDGEFFHYVLGKLGSSLAHMDPKKQGRALCEVFGAYGWAEGNRLMKWIIDYMMVRGINYYVPHAFDPKEYPDCDCPPHFYAHGRDPQFGGFRLLMDYTNRLSHLLSGGIHKAPVALLYHGEAEWSGEYMLMQKPAKELTRNQIDFDILPIDGLMEAEVSESGIKVNQETFQGLVLPYAEALPGKFLKWLLKASEHGLYLYWLKDLPNRTSQGEDACEIIKQLKASSSVRIVSLETLAETIRSDGLNEISVNTDVPYLRYYHYEQEDGHIYFFVNEHPYDAVTAEVKVSNKGPCFAYCAMENKRKEDSSPLTLNLSPYESKMVIFPRSMNDFLPAPKEYEKVSEYQVKGPYQVSFATYPDFTEFKEPMMLEKLRPLQEIKGKEEFTGMIRYEFEAELWKTDQVIAAVEGVAEGVKVWVNEIFIGEKICPPYRFDITKALKEGKNRFCIQVSTTLVRERYDYLSQFMLLEPTGITGSITVEHYIVK